MSTAIALTNAAKNSLLDTIFDQLNNGYWRIYSGTKAATPDTAIGAQVKLAEGRFNATAFAAASGGSKVANALTADSDADATGTATWARFLKSDGTTVICDVDVGVTGSGSVIELPTVSIVQHATVQISSMTVSA